MESHNIITNSVVAAVCVILTVAFAVPLLVDSTTTTNVIDNSGNWAKLSYAEDATTTDYSFEISTNGETVTVGTQSGTSDVVLYADDNGAIVAVDGVLSYITESGRAELGSNVSVTNTAGTLTVSDGVTTVSSSPTWAYYADANGAYATCTADEIKTTGEEFAAVGYFAGVYTYNDLVAPDLGLTMNVTEDEDIVTSVVWSMEE